MDQQTRFIILAGPRTGSTYLVDFLDAIPDISCCSELFHDRRVDFRHHAPADPELATLAFRDADPVEFIARIVEQNSASGWFGFKMIGNQLAERGHDFIERVCRSRNWKKIYLWRDDLFEQSISILLASRHFGEGSWERTPDESRIAISPQDMLGYLHLVQTLYFMIETVLAKAHSEDVFGLNYSDLGRPEVMRELLRFLDLPEPAIEQALAAAGDGQKLAYHPGPDLAGRIENFAEIRQHFRKGRYRHLLTPSA